MCSESDISRPKLRVPIAWHEDIQLPPDSDVTVLGVGPTGIGALDPLVTATAEGRTAFYPDSTVETAGEIAADLADGVFNDASSEVVDHDADRATLPTPDELSSSGGPRRVLGGCGWRRPADPTDHRGAGGFVDRAPDEIRRAVEALHGRGWGDWRHDQPVAEDWRRLRADGGPTAVVVNAHGTTPDNHGRTADALLLESVPFEVLEGAQLAARVVGADAVFVYAAEDDERAVAQARRAARSYPEPAVPIDVVTGPPVHRATEPTMALEAIEGNHRLEARLRPTDAAVATLDGVPTLVHTARTFAHAAVAARDGEPPSTRLVTVSGDVEQRSTVELPEDAPLAAALETTQTTGEFQAACVGGRFGGLTKTLDVPVAPDALAARDLGTEGTIEILNEERCLLEFVGKRAQFAADANCGRCVPCREGATQLTELLRDVYDGEYAASGIRELVRVMDTSSVCEFGVNAGRPARTAVDAFDEELLAHADGRCPAGTCFDTPDTPDTPEVSN